MTRVGTSESEVVVVGAGAAGLATAAALRRLEIEVLVVERADRAGASWHARYDGLRLNTVRWMSDLPGRRMERHHGRWPTREAWALYLDDYATELDLRVVTGTEVTRIDRHEQRFTLTHAEGEIAARMAVVATGHDHTPTMPEWRGRRSYRGRLLHAAEFRSAADFHGQDVLVVGSGNSGCEIATLLADGGAARVRIAIRTPPLILRREVLGLPVTPFAALAERLPDAVLDRVGWALPRLIFGDLSVYGLPRSPQRLSEMKRRYFAPPIDSGFVDAVKRGAIEVVGAVERFDGDQVVLRNGELVFADTVIAATGYRPALEPLVGHLGVLRDDGEPIVRGGCGAGGLFFAGFRFGLYALLPYIERDAHAIGRTISAQIRDQSTEPLNTTDRTSNRDRLRFR